MVRYVLEIVVRNLKATQKLFGLIQSPPEELGNGQQELEVGLQELEVGLQELEVGPTL